MQIHLKQTEIEAALRQYLTAQGTNLRGRTVAIVFTSGRNPSGLTAAIDIGDVTDHGATGTEGSVGDAAVASAVAPTVNLTLPEEEPKAPEAQAPVAPAEVEPVKEAEEQSEAGPATVGSLFG